MKPTTQERYELVAGTSSKFWQWHVAGSQLVVEFGRIGGSTRISAKDYVTPEAARTAAAKLVREKTGKGYSLVTGATPAKTKTKTKTKADAKPPRSQPPASALTVPKDVVAQIKALKKQIESFGCFEITEFKINAPASAGALDAARVGTGPLHADLRAFYAQCDGATLRWRFREDAQDAIDAFQAKENERCCIDPDYHHGFSLPKLATLKKQPWELMTTGDDTVGRPLAPLTADELLARCAVLDLYDLPEGEYATVAVSSEHRSDTLVCTQESSGCLNFDGALLPFTDYIHLMLATAGERGERGVFDPDKKRGVVALKSAKLAKLRKQLLRF